MDGWSLFIWGHDVHRAKMHEICKIYTKLEVTPEMPNCSASIGLLRTRWTLPLVPSRYFTQGTGWGFTKFAPSLYPGAATGISDIVTNSGALLTNPELYISLGVLLLSHLLSFQEHGYWAEFRTVQRLFGRKKAHEFSAPHSHNILQEIYGIASLQCDARPSVIALTTLFHDGQGHRHGIDWASPPHFCQRTFLGLMQIRCNLPFRYIDSDVQSCHLLTCWTCLYNFPFPILSIE